MPCIKFIIDGSQHYKHVGDDLDLEDFFLSHEQFKKGVVYRVDLFYKQKDKYLLSPLNNIRVYIDKQVLILNNKYFPRPAIFNHIRGDLTVLFYMTTTDETIYQLVVTDNKKTYLNRYFVETLPLDYTSYIKNRLKRRKYHIEYMHKDTIRPNIIYIEVLVTICKTGFWDRLKLKFKN